MKDQLHSTEAVTKTYSWFKYDQNNSGGHFRVNDDVSIFVLIQAASFDEANAKAEEVGIYFDGCATNRDCDCCGDRWYESRSPMDGFKTSNWRNGTTTDHDNVRDYAQAVADDDTWAKGQPAVIVYFADGSVERFTKVGK